MFWFCRSPRFIRHSARSEGEAQNLGLPRRHFVDHGSTPRPIDTAVQYCAVHMTADPFAFGRHGDSFGTVDVLDSPPTSQGLAHTALDTLKPLPVTVKMVSKYIENFTKWQTARSACPRVCVCWSTTVIPACAPCPGPTAPQ